MPERLFSDSFYEIFSSNAMLRIARDRDNNNLLVEGVIDLAFEQVEVWTVVDFKTDEEFRGNEPAYRRQVAMYIGDPGGERRASFSTVNVSLSIEARR